MTPAEIVEKLSNQVIDHRVELNEHGTRLKSLEYWITHLDGKLDRMIFLVLGTLCAAVLGVLAQVILRLWK